MSREEGHTLRRMFDVSVPGKRWKNWYGKCGVKGIVRTKWKNDTHNDSSDPRLGEKSENHIPECTRRDSDE